jgi:hypothetical protein
MNSVPEALEPRTVDSALPRRTTEETPSERHLRAVPPRRRRQPRVGLWIGSIVTATSLFLLVAFNVFMVQGQFELDHIANQRTLEQKRYEQLRDRVATLSSPEVIVSKARAHGFVDPPTVRYIGAPAAGRAAPKQDNTATTQNESWREAKGALDASP